MVPECCFSEWEQEIWLYLDGELTEEQRLRVERHLEKCHRCSRFVADIRPLEKQATSCFCAMGSENPLPNEFTQNVMANLPGMVTVPVAQRIKSALCRGLSLEGLGRIMRHHPVTVAALFLLCLSSLFSIWLGHVQYDYRVKVIASGERAFLVSLSENIRCTDPNGQLYELQDGSFVFAQPGTVFSIETYQNHGDDRWISLKHGEIWLDVQTQPREGFTVSTPEARIKVMGTCFAVRRQKRKTKVEVARGSVLVESGGRNHPKSCRLKVGKRITADHRGRLIDWGPAPAQRIKQVQTLFNALRSGHEELFNKQSDALFTVPKR